MANRQELWDAMNTYRTYEKLLLSEFPDIKHALETSCLEWIKTILNSDIKSTVSTEIKKSVLEVLNTEDLENMHTTEYSISGLNLMYYSMFLNLTYFNREETKTTPVPQSIELSPLIQSVINTYKKG